MKLVINTCYGGFSLSPDALDSLGVKGESYFYNHRDDPHLVEIVERLGAKANGKYASLKVVEIPDDVTLYSIEDSDGVEHVAEIHRTWS